MKRIFLVPFFVLLSLQVGAQTDYLEPVKPLATYAGELGEYYRNVFSLLSTGFQKQPYARFVVIPSFSPEYALSVEKKKGKYYLLSNAMSSTYWQSEKGTVSVEHQSVAISYKLYRSLGDIFRLATTEVQDLDGHTAGLDGVVYYFAATSEKGLLQEGRKWSPEKGTLMERLVMICQSAYWLSQGKDISETALTQEAAALLAILKKRSKDNPEAYKKPVYVGLYKIGPGTTTLSGKMVEQLPEFLSGAVDDYVAGQLVYPPKLLEANVDGYAVCEFTIDKSGLVLRPHVLKATYPEFGTEAKRIVDGMPAWKPAMIEGKAVGINYTLYVPFRAKKYQQHLLEKKQHGGNAVLESGE